MEKSCHNFSSTQSCFSSSISDGRYSILYYGLDDFEVALCVCPNHTDDGIYSDHGYLDTLEIPLGPP